MCGDGDGLLKEIFDATVSMIASPPGECSSYLEDDKYPRPDDPGITDCLTLPYLQGFADWLDHIKCGKYKYAPCPDQCYYAPEGYFVLPEGTPEVVALLYRGVISWYFKWDPATEPGETAEILDSADECPELCALEYQLFAPSNVLRGTAFNLHIQAVNIGDGQPHLTYQPVNPPVITFTSTDGGDAMTPLTVPITGWSNGAITISCTITGGTVPAEYNITVSDEGCPEGELEGEICATLLEKAYIPGSRLFHGQAGALSGADDDWTSAAETLFNAVMPNAQAAFDVQFGLGPIGGGFHRRLYDSSRWVNCLGTIRGGFCYYIFADGEKAGIVAAKLYAKVISRFWTQPTGGGSTVYGWNPYAAQERLKIYMTETPSAFTTGGQLKAAAFQFTYTMQAINALQSLSGGSPDTPVFLEIPIDEAFITSMIGNVLYVWIYIDGPTDYEYSYSILRSSASNFINGEYLAETGPALNLRLYY
jgi:hypothetical protein